MFILTPGEFITLKNDQGDLIPIQSKNIYQTRINLGHAKAPGDSRKTKFGRTLKTAVNIGDTIAQCGGTRSETKCCIDLYGNLQWNKRFRNLKNN
jgi:hypothetical protein